LALPTTKAKDIMFGFILEYNNSLRDFYRPLLGNNNNNNNRSIFLYEHFLKDNNILACVIETWEISYKSYIISGRILVSFRGFFFFNFFIGFGRLYFCMVK